MLTNHWQCAAYVENGQAAAVREVGRRAGDLDRSRAPVRMARDGGSLPRLVVTSAPTRAAVMRFFKQVVLPIAILLGVIALVTYVAHFRVTPRSKPLPGTTGSPAVQGN